LSPGFLDDVQTQVGARAHNRVYNPLVILWLLILQRLHRGASLETAVLLLLRGLPTNFWPRPCKRIRDWQQKGKPLSSNTGAYNQARQALPLSIVQKSCDRIVEQLFAQSSVAAEGASRTFIVDGSSMRVACSPSLSHRYPAGSNQHGEAHWPLLRVLVLHELYTGYALRPEWGAMYGPDAVSEQQLVEKTMERLPGRSTLLGDVNFGVFSVAYAAAQRGHHVLLRLQQSRARRLAGEPLRDGIDRPHVWKPSEHDRRRHAELPADACVCGRLIVRQVQPEQGKPFFLALFTTLQLSQAEILNQYGQRWNIETDLRTLKRELALEHLTCSSPDMVAKEIETSIAAFNLVRSLIRLASEKSGIPPRRFSFTRVQRILQIIGPTVAEAQTQQEAERLFNQMMKIVEQAKLPNRRRKRPSYPRVVWKRGAKFPNPRRPK
jgi:hypothetical protein